MGVAFGAFVAVLGAVLGAGAGSGFGAGVPAQAAPSRGRTRRTGAWRGFIVAVTSVRKNKGGAAGNSAMFGRRRHFG